MKEPAYSDAFEVLCLQLGDDGRKSMLLGDSAERAREVVKPFVKGTKFPSLYFEFPLAGEPFLDVTVLYTGLEQGTRIESEAADGTGAMLDWYGAAREEYPDISCGFELDTKNRDLTAAAIHFQPRKHLDLVAPFCDTIGENERAELYLEMTQRMPKSWPLSFFGMFRGRPDSPLRICGYLDDEEVRACARSTARIAEVFDEIGFESYDEEMLARISALMAVVPQIADFQFDVYPDGRIGDMFAIDASFAIEQPAAVHKSFEGGPAAKIMRLLEDWGAVDERWKAASGAAFARSIPIERDDGSAAAYAFTLLPQWAKIRWRAGELQPAKLYYLGGAGVTDRKETASRVNRDNA